METELQHDLALKEQANKGSKMIWVTFRKEGIHKYPAALDDPKLATGDRYDVSFLGYPHRHICLLYTSPSPRDRSLSRMPSSA